MRLSEAIRLGAMLKPQAFGDYWSDDGTCAIGAACEAHGIGRDQRSSGTVAAFEQQFWRVFQATCPSCGVAPDGRHQLVPIAGFCNTVIHLNDKHKWTREQIADWVESVEALESAKADDAVARAVTSQHEPATRD